MTPSKKNKSGYITINDLKADFIFFADGPSMFFKSTLFVSRGDGPFTIVHLSDEVAQKLYEKLGEGDEGCP